MFQWIKKLHVPALFLLLGIGIALTSCSTPDKKEDTLIVGLQSGYPPYEFIDEKGQVVGFDVDIAQKLADEMNKKLVIEQMGFDSLILALKQKKIDLIISGMSITSQRLKEIAMVPYYGDQVTSLMLIFWEKIPDGIHSMEDFKNLPSPVISVQSGNFQEDVLHQYTFITPKGLENSQELIMDIKYGKSIAALLELSIGKEIALQYPEVKTLEIVLPVEYQIFGNGIGINKNRPELIESVKKLIDSMKQSGEIEAMHQSWFKGAAIPAKKNNEPPNGAKAYSPGEGSPARGNAPLGKKELAGIAVKGDLNAA